MKLKKNILKSIGMLLAFIMLFQQIPVVELKANAAFPLPKFRVLFYTDAFKTGNFNNITDINVDDPNFLEHAAEAALDAANGGIKLRDWKKLTVDDQLSPGEIHRRVQDDLWFRYGKRGTEGIDILDEGELPITYDKNATAPDISIDGKDVSVDVPSKMSGRADIYKSNENKTTGLWEVKPPSYWKKNKALGILQLAGYVYFGVDEFGDHSFRFGEVSNKNTITGGYSSFNAYYLCTDLVTVWPETVTYEYNYSITTDSLIIYNFRRLEPEEGEHALSPAAASAFAFAAKKLLDNLKDKLPGGSGNSEPQPGYSYNYDPGYEPNPDTNPGYDPNPGTDPSSGHHYIDEEEEAQCQRLIEALTNPVVIGVGSTIVAGLILYTLEKYSSMKPSELIAALASGNLSVADAMGCFALPAFAGYGYDDELKKYVYGDDEEDDDDEDDDLTEDIHDEDDDYGDAGNAAPPRDPLAIDFGAAGINLTTLENGVNFDLDNNGFEEKTAWIGTEDGFLALDVNGNQKIDNGSELFGDQFILSNGKRSEFGFEALSDFDENNDQLITEEDPVFQKLLIWIDKNHNGKSESDELYKLIEKNITSISVDYTEADYLDTETGTYMAETAVVTLNNAQTSISEFWFDVDTTKTTHNGSVTSGNVPSFEDAINGDETGETAKIYMNFLFTDDFAVKRYYLKQFLYKITGSENIDPNSRGGNIDARDLHMIEQFMGRTFVGVGGENPNAPAAEILKKIGNRIENIYYCILSCQTDFNHRRQKMVNGDTLDITPLTTNISGMIACGDPETNQLIYDLGVYLRVYDHRKNTHFFDEFLTFCKTLPEEYAAIADISGSESSTYIGTNDANNYKGLSNINYLFGLDENDSLTGNNGNDILYGGKGNDKLYGGNGNDTYVIEVGHGNDIINDTQGVNLILFADCFTEDDYSLSVDANLGFVMTNKETGEKVSVPDFLKNPLSYKFSFGGKDASFCSGVDRDVVNGSFADDYLEAGDGFNIFYGGDGDDVLNGGKDMDFMYGGEGNDTLNGRNGLNVMFGEGGDDTLYAGDDGSYLSGGDGNDKIYGGGGADVLDGGKGDDFLQGDHGDNTYIYGKGYDHDIIDASSDNNTILIKDYTTANMKLSRNLHNDLIIRFGGAGTNDILTIDHFFDYNSNRDISFVFETEGDKVYGQYEITENRNVSFEPAVDDNNGHWMGIYVNDNVEYHALGGNDMIGAGTGNDILDGGSGDDTLSGSTGIDTYIFAKGYDHDTINEWSNEKSIIKLFDITSDEVEFVENENNGNSLDMIVKGTEDVLTISNFRNGNETYEFRFADLITGTVNKDTLEFIATKESVKIKADTIAAAQEAFENEEEFALDDTDWVNTAYMHLDEGLECFGDPTKIFDRTSLFVPNVEEEFETIDKTYVGQVPAREADTILADDISANIDNQIVIVTENLSEIENLLVNSSVE